MRVMVIGARAADECYQSDDTACIETAETDPNMCVLYVCIYVCICTCKYNMYVHVNIK